jgi:diguanylate cyclase (GGDEF)-like protein
MSSRGKAGRFDYSSFWTRSLNTAVAARELALVTGFRTDEEAFLAGLLQDIGIMVLGQCAPAVYQEIIELSAEGDVSLIDVEREHLGVDHVEVARLLFEKWNLPPQLCVPILYHHAPEKAERSDEETLLSIRIQNVAGHIGAWLYLSKSHGSSLEELKDIACRYLTISPKELEALLYRVDMRMEEIAGLFELNVERPNTYSGLLEKVQATLGDIVTDQERLLRELEASKIEAQKLAEQLRTANRLLLKEVRMDSLTGLANRQHFEDFLHRELNRSFRYNHSIALLFLDLDNLKSINDRYGHLEGSNSLRHCAEILKRQVRASDLVARYGGDEFVIALVETGGSDAMLAAERVRQRIAETPFVLTEGSEKMHLTASIGVTAWEPKMKPISMDVFLERADSAMYQAKRAGKNRISLS